MLALQVAVASTAGSFEVEQLTVQLDGQPASVEEVELEHGGRAHIVSCGAGQLTVDYHAIVQRVPVVSTVPSLADRLVAVRPSRYCPSDLLEAFADAEWSMPPDPADRGRMIGNWVSGRLSYEPGSSGPMDTAVDTLLAGRGVCRDFAHLTIALCRAAGVPARLTSVYAPGVSPMDFHAVVEVATGDHWEVVDATRRDPLPHRKWSRADQPGHQRAPRPRRRLRATSSFRSHRCVARSPTTWSRRGARRTRTRSWRST